MKGIKKLFFGLIFLTLFSVGFKVDAKAYTLTLKEPSSWEDDGLVMTVKFTKDEINKAVDYAESDSHTVECGVWVYDGDGEKVGIATATVDLIKYGKNDYDVRGADGEGCKVYDLGNLAVEVLVEKGDIDDYLFGSGDSISARFCPSCDLSGEPKFGSTITVKAYKAVLEAWNAGKNVTRRVEVEPEEGYIYLLKGETGEINVGYSPLGEKLSVTKAENCYVDDNPDDSSCVVHVEGTGKKITAKITIGVDSDFLYIPELEGGRKIGLNNYSDALTYVYDGDLEEDIKSVTLGGQTLGKGSGYIIDDDTIRFRGAGPAGTKVLKITMKNGAVKEFKNIQIVDTSKISCKISDTLVAYTDMSVTVTPTVTGVKVKKFGFAEPDEEEFDDSFDGEYFDAVTKTNSFVLTGDSVEDLVGQRMQIRAYYDIDEYVKKGDEFYETSYTTTVRVVVHDLEDLELADTVYVNEGLKIKLNKFVSPYDSSMAGFPVTITNKATSLISVPSSGKLGDVEISGNSAGRKDSGLIVNGGEDASANVIVYPKPKITLDSSSSSSSSSSYSNATYKFTIKMPAGLYHDDKKKSGVSEIELTVKSSSGDEKHLKNVTGSSSTSSSSVEMRSFSTTITARELADALGKSSDSVTIRAYAYDSGKDEKVYAEYSLSYNTGSSSSSSSSSGSGKGGEGGSGSEYDDVPKTGESKTDIWVLWTVLFIAILGAGFMIYKRFGLVRAIAEAEEEFAAAEHEERVEAARKEKEDKINMLKDLRNL